MLNFLYVHQWVVLGISETTAWIFTFLMAWTRYRLHSTWGFYFTSAVAGFTGWIMYFLLDCINFYYTKQLFQVFDVVTVVLLVVGILLSKKYLIRLDSYLENKFSK